MLTATLITGPVGSSKSTLGELVVELAKQPREILWIDSSRCLANSRKHGRDTKTQLLALEKDQDEGFILPGRIVVRSVMENLNWLGVNFSPINILVPGCPRSLEEIDEWNLAVSHELVSYRIIFVECTEKQIEEGVNERIRNKAMRRDDGPRELANRLKEYNEKTLPMIDALSKTGIVTTSRSKPLVERLRDVVTGMKVPDHMRKTWLNRLSTTTHPIHHTIRGIEGIKELCETTEHDFLSHQIEVPPAEHHPQFMAGAGRAVHDQVRA